MRGCIKRTDNFSLKAGNVHATLQMMQMLASIHCLLVWHLFIYTYKEKKILMYIYLNTYWEFHLEMDNTKRR